MGTYIEAAQAGAEVIISSGGHGPCRAGLYGEIHQKILQSMGYDTEIIIFDSIFKSFSEFYRKLDLIRNGTPWIKLLRYIKFCFKMISQMDEIERGRR